MFEEMISRGCVLTFDNGEKMQARMYYKKKNKRPVTMKELERELVDKFNNSQPNLVHKVVKCHLMRN